jgi:hypothetical protein
VMLIITKTLSIQEVIPKTRSLGNAPVANEA